MTVSTAVNSGMERPPWGMEVYPCPPEEVVVVLSLMSDRRLEVLSRCGSYRFPDSTPEASIPDPCIDTGREPGEGTGDPEVGEDPEAWSEDPEEEAAVEELLDRLPTRRCTKSSTSDLPVERSLD